VQPQSFRGKRAEPSISKAPFPPHIARLHGVPDLPPHYLPREADLAGLKQKVLSEDASVAITGQGQALGVQGMDGIGKTVLTAALPNDLEVRQAFSDGIYWLTILRLWDFGSGQMIRTFQGHTDRVMAVEIVANGHWVCPPPLAEPYGCGISRVAK
jgi:hypothetical protein